jgi:hypothetical protein
MKRVPRLSQCLLALEAGHLCMPDVAKYTGWDKATASQVLSNAKALGYVEVAEPKAAGLSIHRLTVNGMQRLACERLPADAASIGEQALLLIEKEPAGLNSGELADRLQCLSETVEEALALHVSTHRLVACAVKNSFGDFTHYRVSAGVAQVALADNVWKKNTVTPTPAPAPAAPKPAKVAKPAPAPSPLPLVGEIDIDAICRKPVVPTTTPRVTPADLQERMDNAAIPPALRGGPAPNELVPPADFWSEMQREHHAAPVAPAAAEGDDEEAFLCALFSSGTLVIESDGNQLSLPVEHTRQLLHYLDHIRADLLTAEVPL